MWCFSGRFFWPLDPRADEVDIDDIAHGLSNECRYAGQCLDYYSVAEHSVIVSLYVERAARDAGMAEDVVIAWALEGLLHDAPEAYIGDIIRPLKYLPLFAPYLEVETSVDGVIREHFARWLRPTAESARLIKLVDNRILTDEIGSLINDPDMDYVRRKFGDPLGAVIACLSPNQAEHVFLTRFAQLCPTYAEAA